MEDRKQFTKVGDCRSPVSSIGYGVPQGSILGPFLYLLYINDLSLYKFNGKQMLYADDMAMFYINEDDFETEKKIKDDLQKLSMWTNTNGLTLNTEKCYIIHIDRKKRLHQMNLHIKGLKIQEVKEVKYLGIILDEHLSWDKQVQRLNGFLCSYRALAYKLRLLPIKQKKMLYEAFIKSKLTYMIHIWATANKNTLEKLQRNQNKLMKIIYNKSKYKPTSELYMEIEELNIEELRKLETLKLIRRIDNGEIEDEELQLVKRSEVHRHNTRIKHHLDIKKVNTNMGQKMVMFQGLALYNSLEEHIKKETNNKKFARKVKDYIMKNRNSR